MYYLRKSFELKLVEKTWFRSLYKVKDIFIEVRSVNSISPHSNTSHWNVTYKGRGKSMKPFTDNNIKESWNHCIVKNSLQLYNYNLWKCPPIAYLQDVLKKFN